MGRYLLVLGLAVVCHAAGRVDAWVVDSLIKVFPDDAARSGPPPLCLVPRNGHGSVQIALRSATPVADVRAEIKTGAGVEAQVRRVGYVPVGSNPAHTPYDEVLRAAPSLFPDPLLEDFPFDLPAGRTESLWITLRAAAGAAPGDRATTVTVYSGDAEIARARFTIRVARVAVPEARTLDVTNWFNLDQPDLARHFQIGDDDAKYWELLGNIGRVMAEHRQTAILTPVFSLTRAVANGDVLTWDFSRLDRWVETFDKAGLRLIEGGHLLGRASEYFSPIVVPAHVIEGGQAVVRNLEPSDPRAEQFFASFLPALYEHIRKRGWEKRWIQHIHDEPHDEEIPVYERFGAIIKKHLPGIPTIDAVGLEEDTAFLERVTDIWVPVLGSFDRRLPKIREHVAKGGQAWFYTCIGPQGRYLNRFIDYPLLKTRLLHWFNFRHGFTGFLHWGGNYWGPRPFDNVQPVINSGRTLLPAGDNAIVYPDAKRNAVLSSIRLEQMREGIEEYEILVKANARGLAERAIPNINDYVRDVTKFRVIQAELLGESVKQVGGTEVPRRLKPALLKTWLVDGLTQVFPDTQGTGAVTVHAARRSHPGFQLAIRSDTALGDLYVDALPLTGPGMPIETVSVQWVDYVVVTSNTPGTPPAELVGKAPGLFPDPLRHEFPMTAEAGRTRPVWITISVPAEQEPGTYRGILRVRQGSAVLEDVPYTLELHKATVPEKIPLAVTNHFTFSDSLIESTYGCSRWTAPWWSLVGNIARFLGRYHQTSVVASPVTLASARVEDGRLRYDFANFERFVATFRAAGVDGQIEGGDLLFRERRRGAPIRMRAWVAENGQAALRMLPWDDPRARQFVTEFLPELRRVLEDRGWTGSYLQGILDEPHEGEHDAFAQTAAAVRKLLPGVRFMEPVGAKQDLAFMRDIDILVPQLGTFDEARLAELKKLPGELWFYTALTPRGLYPNRFIDYPVIKTRILHWMNHRYGFRGWLHWGGNYWGPEPFKDTQPVINQGRTYLPPGDAYITYPDRLGRSLYSSIRLEQMREGIEDFTLLDQLAKRDPARAAALAQEAVRSFTDYVRDPARFRAIHLKLLE